VVGIEDRRGSARGVGEAAAVKAQTGRQPWASLIGTGIKDVENHFWRTSSQGPGLIHAGLGVEVDDLPVLSGRAARSSGPGAQSGKAHVVVAEPWIGPPHARVSLCPWWAV
jgi:hypothetical protein